MSEPIRDPNVDRLIGNGSMLEQHDPRAMAETVTLVIDGKPVVLSPGKATAYLLAQVHAELIKLNANIEEVRERFAPRNLLHPRRKP